MTLFATSHRPMPPAFIYFDLGKVLVDFTVDRFCGQVSEVAGVGADRVREAVFRDGLQTQFELGQISENDFFEAFCEKTGTRPDRDALRRAAGDIFDLKAETVPVAANLAQAGFRLGILSNTCRIHWEHCAARFRVLPELFPIHALSYEIHAMKPDPAIYRAAAELAGVAPEEIFFTDDMPGHAEGAIAAGFDAVPFTTAAKLAADLRARGVRFNY